MQTDLLRIWQHLVQEVVRAAMDRETRVSEVGLALGEVRVPRAYVCLLSLTRGQPH